MSQRSHLRLIVLQVLVLSLMLTLFGRLYYLQVIAGDQYTAAAAENRIRDVVTPATRGLILDQVGRPVVQNRTSIVVAVDRTEVRRQDDGGEAVLRRLAKALDLRYRQVFNAIQLCGTEGAKPPPVCWNGSPYQPIPVAKDVPTEVALSILERSEDFPGVSAGVEAVRDYPSPKKANAAHLVGYLGPVTEEELAEQKRSGDVVMQSTDLVGRAGLEAQYDAFLRGEPGVKSLAVDKNGSVEGTVAVDEGKAGNYVVTNINAELQAVVEKELEKAVKAARTRPDVDNIYGGGNYRADSAAGVVMDLRDGKVLAMASYPTYDPEVWVGGISSKQLERLYDEDAGAPLIARPWAGLYPPASTFKVVSTSAAVEDRYPFHTTYACPSHLMVGDRRFNNYEGRAGSSGTQRLALEQSCDTMYYKFAYEMWQRDGANNPKKNTDDNILRMAERYGFGSATGLDLPSERQGLVPDREHKQRLWEQEKDRWCAIGRGEVAGQTAYQRKVAQENCTDGYHYRAGDAVNTSIGQGSMLVSPLQLANAYGALGNGGTLWQPQVMRAVLSPTGEVVEENEPAEIGELGISRSLRNDIVDALDGVTVRGTAAGAFSGFPLGRIGVAGKTGTAQVANQQTTAWFASFAPSDDPQYAVVIMISQGGTGGSAAAPAARGVYEALFGVKGSRVRAKDSVLPGGEVPKALPSIRPDGTIAKVTGRSASR